MQIKKSWEILTTPTITPAFGCDGFTYHNFQYTISGIESSATVRALGSIDGGANYQVLKLETKVANGTYGIPILGYPLDKVQFELVSCPGSASATNVLPTYKGA